MSSKNKFIEGLKTIAGWAIFVVIILFLVRSCGGEAEDLDTSDPKLTQELTDWYNKKKEELDENNWYCGPFQRVWSYKFDDRCGELTTDNYYAGPWKDNERHGWGVMEWPDGTKYRGNFKEGYREGFGTMEWPSYNTDSDNTDWKKYEGYWKRGDFHGYGELEWYDGSKKASYWKDDKSHGLGSFEDKDGVIYEGQYKNGGRHGRFEITAPNKEMEVVYYSDGIKVEEICKEIGFPEDSPKYKDCIIELVAEALSFTY